MSPVIFAALAVNAFAYVASLVGLFRRAGRWAWLRRAGALSAVPALHVAWRCGLLLPAALLCGALLVGSPAATLSPSGLGVRVAVSTAAAVALALVSPLTVVDLRASPSPADAAASIARRAVAYADVALVAAAGREAVSDALVLQRDHVSLSGPLLVRSVSDGSPSREAVVITGNGVSLRGLTVDGVAVVLGGDAVWTNCTVRCPQAPCIVADRTASFVDVTVNGVPVASACSAEPAGGLVACLSVADQVRLESVRPPWQRLEARMPGAVAAAATLAASASRAAATASMTAAQWGVATWRVVGAYSKMAARVAWRVAADMACAASAGAERDTERPCPRHYPLVHEATFQATVVVWAVGVPAVVRAAAWAAAAEWHVVRALCEAVAGVAVAWAPPAYQLASVAADATLGWALRWVPQLLGALLDWQLAFTAFVWQAQRLSAAVSLRGAYAVLQWVLVACGPLLRASAAFLAWYRTTTMTAQVSVAVLQTAVIAGGYFREARRRATERAAASTGFAARWLKGAAMTGSATQLLADNAADLGRYAAAHAVGLLIVVGASLLAIIPLLHSAALHFIFPVLSTATAMALYTEATPRRVALAMVPRAAVTLAFQWTVADVAYDLLMELVKPLAIGVAIVAILAVARRRAKPAPRDANPEPREATPPSVDRPKAD